MEDTNNTAVSAVYGADNINNNSNDFWGDFDIVNSSIEEMTSFILSKKTFDENKSQRIAGEYHYLIYITINQINKKIYIGQHKTRYIDDGYIGSGLGFSHAVEKYGKENFKHIILFDFDDFEHMDTMESTIVNSEYIARKDNYNIIKGGNVMCIDAKRRKDTYDTDERHNERSEKARKAYYSFTPEERQEITQKALNTKKERKAKGLYKPAFKPQWDDEWIRKNSEFQKMMHETGQWTCYNEGKTMYHNENGELAWFDDDYVPPDGWIKGKVHDEEYDKFHDELNKLVDELHSLGSTYTWRVGDSIQTIKILIEQRKKYNESKKTRLNIWTEIFDYYKKYGEDGIFEKYGQVDNIGRYREILESYFGNEYIDAAESIREKTLEKNRILSMMRCTLNKLGIEFRWTAYTFEQIELVYSIYMERMETIYEQHADIKEIENKKQQLIDEIGRINYYINEKDIDERIIIFHSMWEIGYKQPFTLYRERRTWKRILSAQIRIKRENDNNTELYNDMYNTIMRVGYKKMCEEFNYTGNAGNLRKRFKKYVKGFNNSDFSTNFKEATK